MSEGIHWGILGTGFIAHRFATDVVRLPDAKVLAVGSRSSTSANTFADKFGIPRRYDNYEAIANDPNIDVVYIATPHPFHDEHSRMCLAAGKAVLCEKPFTINASEARELINFARQQKCFLMEAMWSRFFPAMAYIRQLVSDGAIGDLQLLTADFGFRAPVDPNHRLFNLNLGGGALLDVGIYPVSLASMLFGTPKRITSMAHLGETGVDEVASVILGYEHGQMAVLTTAIRVNGTQEAIIIGTKGRIRIPDWWHPSRLILTQHGKEPQTIEFPVTGEGFQFEAMAVMACLRNGQLESEIMPLEETLSIMETLDAIRAQWGLRYPVK